MIKSLEKFEIHSLSDLENKRSQLPKLKNLANPDYEFKTPGLAIITSEITTHSKVEIPKMVNLYWSNSEEIHSAKFVRASMSIPFFFYPYTLHDIPNAGEIGEESWKEHVRYDGPVPDSVRFVEGGMLSNFPINTFHHKTGIPSRRTFGVRLSTYRESYSSTDKTFG